jgi:hypothetical protein
MGGEQVNYSGFVDRLSMMINALPVRSRAAVFWILGSGLAAGLTPPREWVDWFSEATEIGHRFITTGERDDHCAAIWTQANVSASPSATQLLNSAILCLSTPVGIAVHPTLVVGPWIEHALFPILQRGSLALFDDIAFPSDDEDLDRVFAHPEFQAAANYCLALVASLAGEAAPSRTLLAVQLEGVDAMRP